MRKTARRGFLKSLAVTPLVPGAAAALVPQVPSSPAPSPAPPPSTPSPSASPSGPGPMAWALAEAVRHRFGAQLTAQELAEVAKGIDDNLQAATRLRDRLRLGNADEPVTLFQARPAPVVAEAPPPPPRAKRRRGGR
jgi:hypothetical protein